MGRRPFTKHFQERLGFLPAKTTLSLAGSPRIWIHGASLGEIRVARAVIHSLLKRMPSSAVIVSTVTTHGRNLAREILHENIPVVYAPLDLPGCALKAMSSVQPHVMVFLETELWPVWIYSARKLGIKLALLNGRISPRSFKGYLKFRPFFRSVLGNFDAFSMISKTDADRIMAMGAPRERLKINGNAKYDNSLTVPDPFVEQKMRRLFNLIQADLAPTDPVIVAGSTREGEEEILLDVYQRLKSQYAGILLILAPRHIKRVPDIRAMIQKRGYRYQLRTEIDPEKAPRRAGIVIVDTFGDLINIYSIATLVFCGASLVPLGGQNPLEPALWGKPIIYGPHMEDFLDAKEMLESAGGGIPVANPQKLASVLVNLLDHPEKAREMGRHAREVALKTQAAAHRHAEVIERLLNP